MDETLKVESPAKINLLLEVLGKRGDGYHEIRTIMEKITLHDTLHFCLREGKGIKITSDSESLPLGRKNLVYKAVELIMDHCPRRARIEIHIEKRIPIGAGLGGGSSNAAATLVTLNQALKADLSRRELMKMAVSIGADVPFFIVDGPAIATGIGEKLRKVVLPKFWFVLIYPNFHVSTRWAYENLRDSVLTNRQFRYKIQDVMRETERFLRLLRNDLEPVVSARHPEIDSMEKMLREAGAVTALMTGSGPTVYGVFMDEGGASTAYRKVKRMATSRGWLVLKTESIPASG